MWIINNIEKGLTWLAFNVFKKFPKLLTIPCQWAIKACWAAAFARDRDDPLTKLALDVLGAYEHLNIVIVLVFVCINTEKLKEMRDRYLNAQTKQWRNLFLQIIANHSIYFLYICSKLLFEKQSRIFGFDLPQCIYSANQTPVYKREVHPLWSSSEALNHKPKNMGDKQVNLHHAMEELQFITWVILPNRVADDERRRCGAMPAAPLAFSVRCSSNNKVEAFESQ